jgi:hypothetical protein
VSRDKLILKLTELKRLAEDCLTIVEEQTDSPHPGRKPVLSKSDHDAQLDFGKPIRPFMKKYSKDLSGSRKFVLLLAWLAKGDLKKQVALSEIKKQWNRMTAIVEMDFNLFFTGDAKDRDWVETQTKSLYNLRPAWSDVLKGKG